jgi:hypothetical protein
MGVCKIWIKRIGLAEVHLGRAEKTEGHVLEALRLSPRDTWAYAWQHFAGRRRTGSRC